MRYNKPIQGTLTRLKRFFWWPVLLAGLAFFPDDKAPGKGNAPTGACSKSWEYANGYTFIRPDLLDIRSAYAPYLLDWGTFYRDSFAIIDWQKKENVEEWADRFCGLPNPVDVEDVVYKIGNSDLQYLDDLTQRKRGTTDLGYPFTGNTFAECIVYNGCSDVVDYLQYARVCEAYVIRKASKWRLQPDNKVAMQQLIYKGKGALKDTRSYFLRMRYLYQIVRLAHYSGEPQQTIDLYNDLMPMIEFKKSSIMFYWTLGHIAGALQQQGRYGEAAYRYSLIFRYCSSKRTQAFESFKIRDDNDWNKALNLCKNDSERATLFLMRAGKYRSTFLADMEAAYEADPGNPQLTLLLASEVQYLEKLLLRTPNTDRRFNKQTLSKRERGAADRLILFQEFVRKVVKEKKVADPMVWRCMDGYLEVIAKDLYAAEHTFQNIEKDLPKGDQDNVYFRQIEIWRTLAEMNQLDTGARFDYSRAAKIRKYRSFKDHPDLSLYMQDMIAAYYEGKSQTGLSILTVYGSNGVFMNPSIPVIDQMIQQANQGNEDFFQATAIYDTSSARTGMLARLINLKAITLLNRGYPEAALLVGASMREADAAILPKYSPFRESILDGAPQFDPVDSIKVSSIEFVKKLIEYEQLAKAAEALNQEAAARYYYTLGLGYYNTSYFGYEWRLRDTYRSGYNWNRLAQGPVFPMVDTYNGNYENTDVSKALSYFQKALEFSKENVNFTAKIIFMAARCEQKMWFCQPDCTYLPGSKLIARPPAKYFGYYDALLRQFPETEFTQQAIRECKWLAAYQN
jgi:hypothetical protein